MSNFEGPVLVVDDNLLFSSSLVSALRGLGLEVALADRPGTLLEQARVRLPRAILVNLASRSLDGPARVREIKSADDLAAIPVLGYCGHLETELIATGREAGCDVVVANSAIAGNPADALRRVGIPDPTP